MKDKRSYKVFTIAFCLLISVIALVMTFLPERKDPKVIVETAAAWKESQTETKLHEEETQRETRESTEDGYAEPVPELYQENGEASTIYFTNTDELDDGHTLPLDAQTRMVEATQRYLDDQGIGAGEIRIQSITKETDSAELECRIIESSQTLMIHYDLIGAAFSFEIREGNADE